DVINMIPSSATLRTLIIGQGSIKIAVDVPTVTALSSFIDEMKNYAGFTNVSLDNLENKTSIGIISANVSATLLQTNLPPDQQQPQQQQQQQQVQP
ncbi:MAG: hypothetical protein KGJ07_05290, partial [Patescibacteria group bacterium]|nr:hypothetical protein [Patescibacteria group bacterium]